MAGHFFIRPVRWLLAAWLVSVAGAQGPLEEKTPLQNIAEIRALSSTAALEARPVRLKAVVTYHKPGATPDLVVQDNEQGVYVRLDLEAPLPTALRPGIEVEIEGVSEHWNFAPGVLAKTLRIGPMTTLPAPLAIPAAECLPGYHEARLLRVKGVVQRAVEDFSLDPPRLLLTMATIVGPLPIWVIDYEPETIERFVDAEVEAVGVHLSFRNARLQPIGHRLVSMSTQDITVTRPAMADPFATQLFPIRRLLGFNPNGPEAHRVKVKGVVTWHQPGEGVYLQERRFGMRVLTQADPQVRLGDLVEAVGFATMGAGNAELREGVLKVVGRGPKIIPQKLGLAERMAKDEWDGSLVVVEATVKRFELNADSRGLLLSVGDKFIEARLPSSPASPWPDLRNGSRVRVVGICQILLTSAQRAHRAYPDNFSLLLRTPDDVQVIAPGPWWTEERLRNALLLGSFGFACLLVWAIISHRARHRLGREVMERVRAEEELVQAQSELEQERHRLAAELHDSLHQTLVGAIHQLDLLTAKVDLGPEAVRRHCTLARNLVARSQSEARASVWDLRTQASEPVDLEREFHEVVRAVVLDRAVEVEITCAGQPRRLSRVAQEQLLRLGQEAVVNAVRHAGPCQIRLHLEYHAAGVLLRVSDDGAGFDPGHAPGVRQGHFGLVGMRERVLRIGGTFLLQSAPGKGALIEIEIPIPRTDPPAFL